MNVFLILFCVFGQYIIFGQSQSSSDSGELHNALENKRNIPELSDRELLKDPENEDEVENKEQENELNEDEPNNSGNKEDKDDEVADNKEGDEYNEDEDKENKSGDEVNQDLDKEDNTAASLEAEEKEAKSETPRDEPKGPPQYKYEVKAGDMADLFATNKHKFVPLLYKDFARRVVLKYPVNKKDSLNDAEAEARLHQAIQEALKANDRSDYLIPVKAPPKLVLALAKKSALLEASRPRNPADELMKRDILRSGDFWNGVWKEDVVVPQKVLRSKNKSLEEYKDVLPELETIRVKILPGSRLYDVVSMAKHISPRLLYIINNKAK